MYRRGRSGRERSRDSSRPFSQGRDRDRDRDYDSRYRREERPPTSGHWVDEPDRRGEDRRRDERPLPPPLPSLLPPPPTGPPLGPGHPPEPSNFTRDVLKGPNTRRESRDGARDIPPVDTARRHSGGPPSLPLRKESSEPSPRERGMIGDPPVALSRRQTSTSSWPRDRDRDREDERARGDAVRSRKNSIERNPDQLSHSPIAESPRGYIPPASPATSISAATISTAPAANMAPSAPPPAGNHPNAVTDKNVMLSRIFQEASHAWIKYLEAQSNWKVADKERSDHAEHFNAFPALKERYEGNAKAARKELASATDTLQKKTQPLDRFCNKLMEDRLSQRDAESAIEFCDKIKKELGNSPSLTQFVKSSIPTPVPAPSKDEFLQLYNEVQEMKRKHEEEEKTRRGFANEFLNYKNEQANRLRHQDAKLNRFETVQNDLKADFERVKDENHKTAEEVKKAVTLLLATKSIVDKLEEANNRKGGDVVMGDPINEGALSDIRTALENTQKNVIANQKKLLETSTKFKDIEAVMELVKSEAKALQQKVSNIETSGITRATEPGEMLLDEQGGAVSHEDYATKADIERLVLNIKSQDELLDEFRASAEEDTRDILKEIQTLDQAISEKFQALDLKTTEQITTLLTQQQAISTKTNKQEDEMKEMSKNFGQHFASFHTKFTGDVDRLDQKVTFVENQLESHVVAITHQEQRMNNFTTKDFYERVVQSLIQMNPLLFNYTNQLQHCTSEIKSMKETVRVLAAQFDATKQRLVIAAQSPRPAIQDGSSIDISTNGAGIKSDRSSEGPGSSINTLLQTLETHSNEIKKLDQRIADHIETYITKMNDIKEWTVSATQRLAENTDKANFIMDEIKDLREYLGAIHQRSGSPQIPPSAAALDRWRVVSRNQEAMQGLADENGTS